MSAIDGAQDRASAWIMRRPIRAWFVTLVALFFMTASVPAALIDEAASRGYWAPVIALLWMVVLAAVPLVFPHVARRRVPDVVALLCALCLAPTVLALWAASRGGGRWLPIMGWVLSTWSLELVMRRAVRAATAPRQERAA